MRTRNVCWPFTPQFNGLLLALTVLVIVALMLPGCASLERGDATARLAVTYAALKTIESGDDPAARAAEVAAIARDAQRFLDSETVTVALLEHAVRSRLPADLSPADRLLADALVDAVVAELETRVGLGVLDAGQRLVVNQVLGWIVGAAEAIR